MVSVTYSLCYFACAVGNLCFCFCFCDTSIINKSWCNRIGRDFSSVIKLWEEIPKWHLKAPPILICNRYDVSFWILINKFGGIVHLKKVY